MKSGQVTQETLPLPVTTLAQHRELLTLDAISSPLFPLILGLPWLQVHNPQINWISGEIKFLSSYCKEHCIPNLPGHPSHLPHCYVWILIRTFSRQYPHLITNFLTFSANEEQIPFQFIALMIVQLSSSLRVHLSTVRMGAGGT